LPIPIVTDFVLVVTHDSVRVAVPDVHWSAVTVAGTVNDVTAGFGAVVVVVGAVVVVVGAVVVVVVVGRVVEVVDVDVVEVDVVDVEVVEVDVVEVDVEVVEVLSELRVRKKAMIAARRRRARITMAMIQPRLLPPSSSPGGRGGVPGGWPPVASSVM
jgi:hypothetical protein